MVMEIYDIVRNYFFIKGITFFKNSLECICSSVS